MTKAVIESGVLREDGDAYHLEGPLSAFAIKRTKLIRLLRLDPAGLAPQSLIDEQSYERRAASGERRAA